MEDKCKLGLEYILETVLRCKHHKTSIDVFCLDVVDDVVVFNAYSWGRRCFMDTLHAFKRMNTIKDSKTDRKYDVYGFPLAMQLKVHPILTPIPEEMENAYIQEFYIPSRVPDPILDLYIVGEEAIDFDGASNYFSVMAKVLVESDRVKDQEVDMEIETRDHLEVETRVQIDMETEMEIGQLDIETDGELVVETDGMTDGWSRRRMDNWMWRSRS
ncbi:Uncharacterized protein Adt_18989 [Abeliophyllum distichum]|uniref:Uncharacterized protein n=1 Tax=Abeliophyllum distichum TaxID=126358 RepID=A0ABD1TKX9_9LAMI